MRRRAFIATLGSAAAWPVVARGQQAAMPVVGYIDMPGSSFEAFVQGLNELGFFDHRNVTIDHREASAVGQLPVIAVQMARDKAAVIISTANALAAAKAVTSTIPMVFIGGSDPVALGLAATFNHPGGNVTGVRFLAGDLPSKQIEVIHEFLPTATKVGLLMSPAFPDQEPQTATASDTARHFELTPIVERLLLRAKLSLRSRVSNREKSMQF